MIYKQAYAGQCGSYASLNALQHLGVNINEQEILKLGAILSFPAMKNKLKGLINSLYFPLTLKQTEKQLSKGYWLPTKIIKNNFASVRNPPHINDCQGELGHFICLVEDLGDRFKYIDQQGEDFGDKGYGYVLKSNFKNLIVSQIEV